MTIFRMLSQSVYLSTVLKFRGIPLFIKVRIQNDKLTDRQTYKFYIFIFFTMDLNGMISFQRKELSKSEHFYKSYVCAYINIHMCVCNRIVQFSLLKSVENITFLFLVINSQLSKKFFFACFVNTSH